MSYVAPHRRVDYEVNGERGDVDRANRTSDSAAWTALLPPPVEVVAEGHRHVVSTTPGAIINPDCRELDGEAGRGRIPKCL
jgi:hypothetical protein